MKINGIEVEDVDDALDVVVTKMDIRNGAKKNANACAVAEAICRQHRAHEAIVQTSRAYVRKGRKWKRFAVPPELSKQVIIFDRGGNMAVGKYTLRPVQPSVRLDAQPVRRKKKYKSGSQYASERNGAARPYRKTTGVRASMQGKFDWE